MRNSALLTDYYQFTMAYGYWQQGMHMQDAVFHVFFRRKPAHADYVIASGLARIIEFLQNFQITDSDIDYLAAQKNSAFSSEFLTYLKALRFTGDIDAVPEGSVVFPNEPLLRIKAPLLLCQLLETPIINLMNFSSAVATLASSMRKTAGKDALFEFGLRRAQGPDGGLTASRAAFLGGFDATSNVLAGKTEGIPVVGTMAHSWIMAFEDEYSAFLAYARLLPENIVLLVDTYDTMTGVDHAIAVAQAIKTEQMSLKAIRLDSGDLSELSKLSRAKLDAAKLTDVKIFVSGDLTQPRMHALKVANAPIDGWGVGTHLTTSYDQPALDMVYKLGAIERNGQWHYKLKRSDNSQKTSDPGILQVRRYCHNQQWIRDVIYSIETVPAPIAGADMQDLLIPIFRSGVLLYQEPALILSRAFCMDQVAQYHHAKQAVYTVLRDVELMKLKNKLLTL